VATAIVPPGRWPMTLLTAGIRAVIVGGPVQVAAASSNGGLTAPLITAGGALLAVLIGPLVQNWARNRRSRTLARKDAEIRKLRAELKRRDGAG
jgi:hypothetical protein